MQRTVNEAGNEGGSVTEALPKRRERSMDDKITAAMRVISNLSAEAKNAGKTELMYAANRAWHQLFNVRNKR